MKQRTQPPLPYGRHLIEADDIAAVAEVLESDWLTSGPAVERFEAELSRATGAPHAVACANGTAALHMSAMTLGLRQNDWVIVPAVTFLATANAARYVGADVWFADVDPETGLLTASGLDAALTGLARRGRRARAVFPVHLNGQVADPAGIAQVAAESGIEVIEDAAHAIGTVYAVPEGEARVGDGRSCAMSAFSFHPVKTVAMGEGGAITCANAELASQLRRLRNHGMDRNPAAFSERAQAFAQDGSPNPWYYEMAEPGFNYRASDIQCALGASQLRKLERFVARRRELAALYDEMLAPLAPVIRPVGRVLDCRPAWHLYVVLIDFGIAGMSRAQLMRRLRADGIQTQVHYLPVNRQPYYRARYGAFSLPGADAYYDRCLTLPLFASMTTGDAERVVASLADAMQLTVSAGLQASE